MLVLRRRKNERIVLHLDDGRRIEFTITAISPTAVQVGVEAPRTLKILRAELAAPEQDDRRKRSA
ncbi:MAG: hypothetical protein Kow0040_14940 [Thermogutta sp.]